MKRTLYLLFSVLFAVGVLVLYKVQAHPSVPLLPSASSHTVATLPKFDLIFEPNVGQSATSVQFVAHPASGVILFTSSDVQFTLASTPSEDPQRTPTVLSPAGAGSNHAPDRALPRHSQASVDPQTPVGTVTLQWVGAQR